MIRRPPSSSRTDTRFPYTTLFRSGAAPLAPSRDRGAVGRVSYSALLVLARAWPLRFRAVEPRRLLGDAAEPARERDGILGGAARRIGADRHRAPARHDGADGSARCADHLCRRAALSSEEHTSE